MKKNDYLKFSAVLISFLLWGIVLSVPSWGKQSSKTLDLESIKKEYQQVEQNLKDLEKFIQEAEENRQTLKRLGNALKKTEELQKRLQELDERLKHLKLDDVELPEIQIAGALKEYDGEPLNKPVQNGEILAFQANAGFPKQASAQKRGIVWEVFDKDNKSFLSKACYYDIKGQPIAKDSDGKCKSQANVNYAARLRFKIDHFHPGRYTVRLKHWLLDNPEQKTESLYAFAVEKAKFEIRGLVIHGSRDANDHLDLMKNLQNVGENYFPKYRDGFDLFGYAYYTLPASMEQVKVSLKVIEKISGEVLIHSEGPKARVGDPAKERAGIPIPEGILKPGQKAFFEFSIISPKGKTLTKKVPFGILKPEIEIKNLIVSDNTTADKHMPVLLPSQTPHLFVYYSVPEDIDEVDIYLGVTPRKGKPLFSKKFKKKVKGDRTNQRSGIRLDTIKVPSNKKWFFQAQIKDSEGRAQYKFKEFTVRGMAVTLSLPKRLKSGDSVPFRINVSPKSMQPPFDIEVDTSKELILAYSAGSLNGTLTGAAFNAGGTGRITVTVKKDGHVAIFKGSIEVSPTGNRETVADLGSLPPSPSFGGLEQSFSGISESGLKEVIEYWDDAKTKIHVKYTKNAQGEKHGLFESFNENGTPSQKGTYRHGEKEGLWKDWCDNRQILSRAWNFLNGEFHGEVKSWHCRTGKQSTQENYNLGKRDGFHKHWFENGSIKTEMRYANGNLQSQKSYGTDGSLVSETNIQSGVEHEKSYREDGTLSSESIFSVGPGPEFRKKAGVIREYDDNHLGKVRNEYKRINGKEVLARTCYYDEKSGRLNQVDFYENDSNERNLRTITTFDPFNGGKIRAFVNTRSGPDKSTQEYVGGEMLPACGDDDWGVPSRFGSLKADDGADKKNSSLNSSLQQNQNKQKCQNTQRNLNKLMNQTANLEKNLNGYFGKYINDVKAKMNRLNLQYKEIEKQRDKEILDNATAPPSGKTANLVNNKYMDNAEIKRYSEKYRSKLSKKKREYKKTKSFLDTRLRQGNLSWSNKRKDCGRLTVEFSGRGIGSEGITFNKSQAMTACKSWVNAKQAIKREQFNLQRYSCGSVSAPTQSSISSGKNQSTESRALEERKRRRR